MVSDEIIIKGENPKDDLNRYKQILTPRYYREANLNLRNKLPLSNSSFPVVIQGFLTPSLDSNPALPRLAGERPPGNSRPSATRSPTQQQSFPITPPRRD